MNRNDDFRAAVLQSPEDDDLRLVFADWLDEQDDPRGEFIRVQIELARNPYSPRRWGLSRRQYDLLAEWGSVWARPLIGRVMRWVFSRGFVEAVKLNPEQLHNEGGWLFDFAPIQDVLLANADDVPVDDLIACPHLDRIKGLSLSSERAFKDDDLRRLFGEPRWQRLTSLSLSFMEINAARARALACSPVFCRLRSLTLNFVDLDAAVAAALFSEPLPLLTRLDLASNEVGPEGVTAILTVCSAEQLTALNLDGGELGDEGVRRLASARTYPRLEELNLGSNDLTEAGGQALAGACWPALKHLDLAFNKLRDGGIRALAGSANPPRLTSLDLNYNAIGPEGVAALVASPLSWELAALNLSNNPIQEGLGVLIRSRKHKDLIQLDLEKCAIDSAGSRALLDSALGQRLSWLNLEEARLAPGTFEKFRARMGEGFWHEQVKETYSYKEAIGHIKANPPGCLRRCLCRADTPLTERAADIKHGGIAFELRHPDPSQKPTVLGYHYGSAYKEPGNKVFLCPFAIRWEPSGEVIEVFDSEQHSHPGNVVGYGARTAWKCPHEGCQDHVFIAIFAYDFEPPGNHGGWYMPVQDDFGCFTLDAYCVARDDFVSVACYECH